MTILRFCCGFIVVLAVGLASLVTGVLFGRDPYEDNGIDYELCLVGAWVVSTLGFGVCLSIILAMGGLI